MLLCLASLALVPTLAFAQDEAGIAGTVLDNTGGVLPGVTVTAASPQLIEQTRTAVTDGTGNYRFIALPAGTYSVTFQLQGFRGVMREGIVLEGAFVADVDADLAVGNVSETLTVTGAAPLVDVVSTRDQTVLTADQVNALPASSNIITGMAYVPGVRGNFLAVGGAATGGAKLHGSDGADSQSHIDGVESGTQIGSRSNFPGGVGLVTDQANVGEMVYDTGAQGAEFAQSGVRTNMIPKAGGNTFSGDVFISGGHENFADSNLTPELEADGFAFSPTAYTYSINPSFGGPIKENKLWFFGSFVYNKSKNFRNGIFFEPDEPSTPDGLGDDLRAFGESKSGVQNFRITLQLDQKNKITSAFTNQQNDFGRVVGTGFGRVSSEALFNGTSDPNYLSTTRWTSSVSSRMLIEATVAYQRLDLAFQDFEENGIARIPFSDVATGLQSGTSILQDFATEDHRRDVSASISYVTGSHNFKAGFQYSNNIQYGRWKNNGDLFQALTFNGFPIGILVMGNGDVEDLRKQNCECGFYAQDSMTLDRFTVNGGVRFDWFDNSLAGGFRPAGFFTPEITADPLPDLPRWTNWTGRGGIAFDLSGDGRTALKASAGKYLANEALGVTTGFSPFGTNIDFRTWFDANGDGTAINSDGTPQFAEIGASFNPNYGQPVTAQRLDPDVVRGSNWEFSAGIEHQLNDRWSLSGKWHRRVFGDFRWADNTALSPSDFAAVTFQSPTDSRLTDSGDTLTVYEFADPSFVLNTGDILTRQAPDDSRTWNGFEVIADGRLWRGGFAQASWTIGESTLDFCTVGREENPNALRFCNNSSGYRNDFKLSGGIPLPFDTMISGLFQAFAGNQILGDYQVNADDIGRPLNNEDGNETIALIEPGTLYEGDMITSLALRFSKIVTTGDVRTRIFMDASNLFNTLTILDRNPFFGGGTVTNDEFFRPITLNAGRVLSFGMQTSF
jgi:hypothetical protein